ncbi:phage tail tape measure protein, partial [Rhodopirellula bahusiensis]
MTQVIELSGDAAGLLRAMDQSIAKEKDHERQLGETAAAGSAAGDVLESAMADVAKSNDKVFAGILKDLRRAGPEGREMAKALQSHFADAGKAGYRSIGTVLDQLREIDPEAAAAADKAQAELNSIDDTVDFDSTLGELRGLGGEAAKIAAGISADMKAADAEAAGDMNEILDRLKQIDPTVEQSANRVRQELAEAARFSEGKFEGTLDKLRSMGPVGKKVAEGLKADLVGAGELAEESIDDVIATLRKIDPAAAAAAKKLYTEIDDASTKGKGSFADFRDSAVTDIKQIVGAYVGVNGVQAAIRGVIELNKKVLETNKQIFEGVKQQVDGKRRLLQVSTSAEDFEALSDRADKLSTDYGLDREEARNLVFSARSEGFEGSLDFIASNDQAIDVESQAAVAGQVPTLFRSEGLTGEQAINATLAAAQNSRLSFEQIGGSIASASEGASLTGSTAAETAGSLAALASRFKSADTAADRIKAFALKLDLDTDVTDKEGNVIRESLADIGLVEAVERLQAMSDGDRSAFLGDSQEVNTAYNVFVEELDTIKKFIGSAQQAIDTTGTDQSPTARARAIVAGDDQLQSVLAESKAANRLEISRESNRAVEEGNRQTKVTDELRRAEEGGASPFAIATAEAASDLAAGFGYNDLSSSVIPALAPSALTNLQRDLFQASEAGDTDAGATLLATKKLQSAREESPDAILSVDATA